MSLSKLLFVTLFLLVAPSSFADTFKTIAETRTFSDKVMQKMSTESAVAGLLLVKPYMPGPSSQIDSMIEQTKLLSSAMDQRFGKNIGVEFISETRIGSNLIRYNYMQRFESHPVKWSLYFYNGKDGWSVDGVDFFYDTRLYFLD